jgi:cytochrome c biogenesis protein CcdA
MAGLVLIGIVAGFLAGISPCILPVLPVVLVAGASAPAGNETPQGPPRAGLARSLAVIGGLVLSFSIIVLAGSEILSLLHLPQDALRDAGIALLAVVGLGYLIPPLGRLLVSALASRAAGPEASCSAWPSAWCTFPAPDQCLPRSRLSGQRTGWG